MILLVNLKAYYKMKINERKIKESKTLTNKEELSRSNPVSSAAAKIQKECQLIYIKKVNLF